MCQACYKRNRALSEPQGKKEEEAERDDVEVEHIQEQSRSDPPSVQSDCHSSPAQAAVPPPFSVTPISLGLPPPPFTSHPQVLAMLYPTLPTPAHGLTAWLLPYDEFPLTTVDWLRPPYFHLLGSVTADKYDMIAVAFNLTATEEGLRPPPRLPPSSRFKRGKGKRRGKGERQQPVASADTHLLHDVLVLMKELHDYTKSVPILVLYQKDIERFSAWGWTPVCGGKRKRMAGEFDPVCSPYNPHLFHLHPNNLCSLMLDHSFAGFSSPSWYVKTLGSYFCLHCEQLFAPFYNLCYEGATRWWVVERGSMEALHKYMVWRARRWFGVGDDEVMAVEEEEAVRGFLLTKQVVFHPDELRAHGVQLTEVLQSERMLVMGDGDLVHFGTAADTHSSSPSSASASSPAGAQQRRSVNEAVNVMPLQWLTTGLPMLVRSLRWLRDAWLPMQRHDPLVQGGRATLRLAFRQWTTNALVAHHYAPHWSHVLLVRLQQLLSVAEPPADCPYAHTWLAVHRHLEAAGAVAAVAESVREALELMDGEKDDGVVKRWLLSQSFNQKVETEYMSAKWSPTR